MAKVIVDQAEVIRTHRNGGGFNAHVQLKLRNGETKTEKYTVWTTEQVAVGDIVGFEGRLSVKMEEFENQQGETIRYASIHVNDPVITTTGNSQVSESDAPF
jgi:hypothetical protein